MAVTTNLVEQTQKRIDALTGSESLEDLLELRKTAYGLDGVDISKLNDLINDKDSTIGDGTESIELLVQSRNVDPYPFVDDIVSQVITAIGGFVSNYPYNFLSDYVESATSEVGPGGSTYNWTYPTCQGVSVEGVDKVYIGTVYEAPGDRYFTSTDAQLQENKRRGEAIISVIEADVQSFLEPGKLPYIEYRERAINQDAISYLNDEHHQSAVFMNNTTGQLITGWGSRGAASPASAANQQNICYGRNIKELSKIEKVSTPSVPNYLQMWSTGNSVYAWSRDNINRWVYSVGPGGQNFELDAQVFLDARDGSNAPIQYYLSQMYASSIDCGRSDGKDLRSRVNCFGQGHPTIGTPDQTLRYAMAEYVVGGTYDQEYTQSGLIYKQPTTGTKLGTDGKLGEMGTLSQNDLEVAFQATGDQSYRLLDVQTGFAPRALIGVFNKTWNHGDNIPLGTTWNLVLVKYNEWTKQWSQVTIKTGIRGALGYKPWASNGSQHGIEGFTSFYMYGASFYRGANAFDVAPIIYLAERIGDDSTKHRLTEITLSDDYGSVLSERDLTPLVMPTSQVDYNNMIDGIPQYKAGYEGSRDIIYRPDPITGGRLRGLAVDLANGWSNYESYTATKHLVVLNYENNGVKFPDQTVSINVPAGTKVRFGATPEIIGGENPEFLWEYKPSGGDWAPVPDPEPLDQNWRENTFENVSNGNTYRLKATVSGQAYYSDEIPVTVS